MQAIRALVAHPQLPPSPWHPIHTMWTVILLICSNIFMTIAWYGHLKYGSQPLWKVILVSWSIAFFEYCFQVPANRLGYGRFSPVRNSR